MAQHPTTHIYSTVRLRGKPSGQWGTETAVFGLRIGTWPVADDPGRDAGDVQLHEYLTNDATVSRTISGYSVDQGWSGDSGSDVNITDADQDSIVTTWRTFLTSCATVLADSYELESIRLYNIGRLGISGSAPSIYTPTSRVVGTAPNLQNPSDALCVSLGSALRGPSGRGRFYLGPLSTTVQNTSGVVDPTKNAVIGNAAALLVQGLEAVGGVGLSSRVMIVHRASQTGGAGAARGAVVNKVRIGDELDSQSRRRRQRPEVYSPYALP